MPYAFNEDKSKWDLGVKSTANLAVSYETITDYLDSLPAGVHTLLGFA